MNLKREIVKLAKANPALKPHLVEMLAKEAGLLNERDIRSKWRRGNNAGLGEEVGRDGDITPQIPVIAKELGLPFIGEVGKGDETIYVFGKGAKRVGVADLHGPWAVELK